MGVQSPVRELGGRLFSEPQNSDQEVLRIEWTLGGKQRSGPETPVQSTKEFVIYLKSNEILENIKHGVVVL